MFQVFHSIISWVTNLPNTALFPERENQKYLLLGEICSKKKQVDVEFRNHTQKFPYVNFRKKTTLQNDVRTELGDPSSSGRCSPSASICWFSSNEMVLSALPVCCRRGLQTLIVDCVPSSLQTVGARPHVCTGWGPPVISWFINHYNPH